LESTELISGSTTQKKIGKIKMIISGIWFSLQKNGNFKPNPSFLTHGTQVSIT